MQSFQTYQANPAVESTQFAPGNVFSTPRPNAAQAEKFAAMLLTARSQLLNKATASSPSSSLAGFNEVFNSSRLNMQKKNADALDYAKKQEDEQKERDKLAAAKRKEQEALLLKMDLVTGEQQLARDTSISSHKQGIVNSAAESSHSAFAQSLTEDGFANSSARMEPNRQTLSPQQEAAQRMSQLSSATSEIELNLNALNKANLASPGSGPQLEYADALATMNSQDLRSNLDSLAKQANVSRLNLQMSNPQTLAMQRRDAATVASMSANSVQSEKTLTQLNQSSRQSHLGNAINAQEMFREKLQQKISHMTMSQSEGAQSMANLVALAQGQVNAATLPQQSAAADPRLESALASLQQGALGVNAALHAGTASSQIFASSALVAEEASPLSAAALSTMSVKEQKESFLAEEKDQTASVLGQVFGTNVSAPLSMMKPHASAQMNLGQNKDENAAALHEKVMQMAAKNMKHLTVDLSPNDLGRMRISIDLSHDNEALSVSLAAANEQTRDILEQALPKLKEILAQQHVDTEAVVATYEEERHEPIDPDEHGQQQQDAQQEQKDEQELKQTLYGEKVSGTVFAKSSASGTAADNLTGLQRMSSSFGRSGQALRI